jgi:hypothetical protein
MDVVSSKVCTEVKSLLNGKIREVLVSECNNLTLCNEKRKLVFTGVTKLAQLYAGNFRPSRGSQMLELRPFNKQVLEARVGVFATLGMGKWFPWWVLLTMIPYWQIVWVLQEVSQDQEISLWSLQLRW